MSADILTSPPPIATLPDEYISKQNVVGSIPARAFVQ